MRDHCPGKLLIFFIAQVKERSPKAAHSQPVRLTNHSAPNISNIYLTVKINKLCKLINSTRQISCIVEILDWLKIGRIEIFDELSALSIIELVKFQKHIN